MKDKLIVHGRVKKAGVGNTPVAGSPQSKELNMKGNRVKVAPSLPRKNDPQKTAANRMGLKMGSRVTSREVGKR